MKWSTLTLGLLASVTLAAPVEPTPKQSLYTLRVSSKYAPEIDGSYLTVNAANQVGVFPGASLVKLYAVPSDEHVELHRYPAGDQVLAFVGQGSLLDLAVAKPTAAPEVGTTDWQSFNLVPKPPGGGKPDNLVTYTGGEGSWVAFKGADDAWTVNWKSSDAITIEKRSYMLIDVVYEPLMVAQTGAFR